MLAANLWMFAVAASDWAIGMHLFRPWHVALIRGAPNALRRLKPWFNGGSPVGPHDCLK
jgi:hypothetical protein